MQPPLQIMQYPLQNMQPPLQNLQGKNELSPSYPQVIPKVIPKTQKPPANNAAPLQNMQPPLQSLQGEGELSPSYPQVIPKTQKSSANSADPSAKYADPPVNAS